MTLALHISKGKLHEQKSDFAFWQAQSFERRLGTLEQIRQEYHAWKYGTDIKPMILSEDFRDFIQTLNDNGVQYLVIGGYAVAFHGHPRFTKDLDIWIWMEKDNATRMIQALDQFGFASLGLKEHDFLKPDTFIQLGYPPNRIDLVIGLQGMDFESCYQARIEVEIRELKVNFIDLENLKQTKRLAGRHQDLADLENLE